MKQVPIYSNHQDNMRCMLAAYRSVFDYLLNEKLGWDELGEITGFKDGKAAWTIKLYTYLAENGIDIKMIEPFDYQKYYDIGESYLGTLLNEVELNWQLENTNILEIKPLIPKFLKTVDYECRSATIEDIENMIAEDRLVFVTLNSKSLNDKPGYVNHAILIIGQTDDSFIFHDPGLPPVANRKEKKSKIYKAMGGKNNHNEVTGLKLN